MSDNPLADALFRPRAASTRQLEERKVAALERIAAALERMAPASVSDNGKEPTEPKGNDQ